MDMDVLLTAADVAAILQVSETQAYRLMELIGSIRLGRSIRVSRAGLEEYIKRNTHPPAA